MSAALKVLASGMHSTVQDLGRYGYQAAGVPVSGALDSQSYRLANRLAGNPDNTAALEILFHGPTLEVAADSVRVALAGGDAELELLGEHPCTVSGWQSLLLTRGQVFHVGRLREASCCYLAVEGGLAIAPCLGSAATFVRGGLGGFQGRVLRAGDILPLVRDTAEQRLELRLPSTPVTVIEQPVRVVLGPQRDYFTDAAIKTLLGAVFTVSQSADRMGMRLDGPKLEHRDGYNIVSDGIATGAIQVPGSGQAILLLADHQTTGGYPKIATVISADLPAVGRRRPGDRIRFTSVKVAEAEQICRAQEKAFQALLAGMVNATSPIGFDPASLYQANLISGVVSGQE